MVLNFIRHKSAPNLGKARIEAFSDGVFSIAITLLILEIAIPTLSHTQLARGELLWSVLALWPKILSYIISFAIIGIFWAGHNIMFHFIKRADRMFLWLNILFLMTISFIPFPAALIGQYAPEVTSVTLYGVVLFLAGVSFNVMWGYAVWHRRLVDEKLEDRVIKKGTIIVLIAPIVYFIAICVGFFNPQLAILMYILVPIIYVLPSPVDEVIEEIDLSN